jgi:phage-related protein (TIGR01555 family)
MAWITDSLRSAIELCSRYNPFARADTGLPGVFGHQLAVAAYMSSGMLRKVIAIPADDRVREWRDWQADKDQIELIEAEERRLGLQAKVRQAEVLRGIGGGALILITTGDHASALKPETIGKGGLVAVNVVSRWQITAKDYVRDLASPDYLTPRMFSIDSEGRQQDIHPSRVVCFRGEPLPAGSALTDDEAFWGDSRLLRVFAAVQRSDDTQAWFAALVKKAKLLRIGIPDLSGMVSGPGGDAILAKRVETIATGESVLNAVVFDAGNGAENPGETIADYQVKWDGIPALMDAFDQRVAAVADIPFTRLMGRSPAGMNATGEHDSDNWAKMVSAGQRLETRPCLDQIDPVMLRSAGITNPEGGDGKDVGPVTWRFAPLDTPSEQEEATTFKTTMEAVTALQNTGTIPDIAFSKGLQNLMSEREWVPGLDQALAEVPEAERFPEGPTAEEMAAEMAAHQTDPLRRAANDASPRTLYVQRKLLNAAEVIAWAKAQGFKTTLAADEMHVTVLYSRSPVDWMKMGQDWHGDEKGQLVVPAGGARLVEQLGDKGAVVLLFGSSALCYRHEDMVRNGASHDYDEYQPHVTVTYAKPDALDLDTVEPFRGALRFGPEIFEELDEGWQPGEA